MNFNKYRSKKLDDSFKNYPSLYGYDIKKLSKDQSLNYVKEYISEYIGESIFRESNTSIKNKECIKNIFKYRPKNEHKDITELIDSLVPKRKKNTKQPQTSNNKNKKIWFIFLVPIAIFLSYLIPFMLENIAKVQERKEQEERFYAENGGEVEITYGKYGLDYVDKDGYFATTEKLVNYIKVFTHPTIKDTKIICDDPGFMPDYAVPIEFYDSRDGTAATNLSGFDYRNYIGVCKSLYVRTGNDFEILLSTLKSIVNTCGTQPKSYCIEDLKDRGIIE